VQIADDFSPRVVDFGQACYILPDNGDQRKGLCGTLAYCDPSLFLRQPFEVSCDVYSLGILLWELLEVVCKYVQSKKI
jgi:serine/threonine protein kinase